MRLTPHFTEEELYASDTATRKGIDNSPATDDVRANLLVLAEGLERVRYVLAVPVHINSGYRCEELERDLTTKDFLAWCLRHGRTATNPAAWAEYFARKAHPKGLAADYTAPAFGTPREIVKKLIDNAEFIGFDQCIEEGTWVHTSFPRNGDTPRLEVLTATFVNGTPSYAKGLA